jgi:HK97 family phage portal protein
MAVVFSAGAMQAVRAAAGGSTPLAVNGGGYAVLPSDPIWLHTDYAAIYRAHPFIRSCVDFLSRNIAQLGIHLFRRQPDGGRIRERTHPVARLLDRPNEWTPRYDHICGTIADLGIYGVAYWLKWGERGARSGLVRIPPFALEVIEPSAIGAKRYDWIVDGTRIAIDPADVVRFRWFDPDPSRAGLPPIETLRRIVAEDRAAASHRQTLWQTGARIGGVVERPKDAGPWSPEARDRFRSQWQERYSGPASIGQVPVLEDGMSFKAVTMSLADTQAADMRAANLEDVARVYQIPAPMVGLLEHATYSNVKEQHKHLYQDCLGPICTQIEDTLGLSLLAEFEDPESEYYLEFNLAEKLKGSFEDQARAIQVLVGRPVMTANEGRARLNLPNVSGGDELMQPLNMTVTTDAPPPPAETDQAPRGAESDDTDAVIH